MKTMDYKEKLALAKEALESGSYDKDTIKYIFPELKESEDEKIRKELAEYFKHYSGADNVSIKFPKWIAWLEKQGSEPNWCHHKVDLSDCSEEYRKAYYDGWNNCNMQHSQYELEKSDVLKCLINGMKFYYEDNKEATWGTEKFSMKVKDILSWLENQSKSKFEQCLQDGDKIVTNEDGTHFNVSQLERVAKKEPKFKIGDYLVNDYCNGKVIALTDDAYLLDTEQGISFSCEHNAHLWTIQDAKDGDVLVNGSNIFIFHFINDTRLMGYCHVNTDDGRFYDDIGKNECFCLIDAVIHPATKEQRNLLFQKMKEAGYGWDTEKKELKKISQEYPLTPDECIKPAWSEEDEKMLVDCTNVLHRSDYSTKIKKEIVIWLKSLKDRYTWKPSEEQLKALDEVYKTHSANNTCRRIIFNLLEQLKKL